MSGIGSSTEHEVLEMIAERESNEKLSPEQKRAAKKIPVIEIFGPTIQGEGAMIGIRTTFIRFGLCDYKCTMCDSLHAVLPELVKQNATWMTQENIAEALYNQHGGNSPTLHSGNCHWVTFSGGNPCMHDLNELIMRIRGFDILIGNVKIAVETQGTLLPSWLHMCDVITVSPKGPGMGETFEPTKFREFVLQFKHHPGFNVKVVVFSQADIEFAKHINSIMIDEGLGDKMYMSLGNPFPPGMEFNLEAIRDEMTGKDDALKLELMKLYSVLTEDILQEPSLDNVRWLPQLHVLAWANKQKV